MVCSLHPHAYMYIVSMLDVYLSCFWYSLHVRLKLYLQFLVAALLCLSCNGAISLSAGSQCGISYGTFCAVCGNLCCIHDKHIIMFVMHNIVCIEVCHSVWLHCTLMPSICSSIGRWSSIGMSVWRVNPSDQHGILRHSSLSKTLEDFCPPSLVNLLKIHQCASVW